MVGQLIQGLGPFIAIALTLYIVARASREHREAAQAPWLRAGWTIVRQDVNRLRIRATSVFSRDRRGLTFELVSETLPSSLAPFHEVMGGRFASRWRSYLRVDLGSRRVAPFQLFERAALIKRPIFDLSNIGAVWFPRWRERLSTGDARLDSRFEIYAEDPSRTLAFVAAAADLLLQAPRFGLLEVVGPELRIFVSTHASGLAGASGAVIAANVDELNDFMVELATALEHG